jgi:hypothetical protein
MKAQGSVGRGVLGIGIARLFLGLIWLLFMLLFGAIVLDPRSGPLTPRLMLAVVVVGMIVAAAVLIRVRPGSQLVFTASPDEIVLKGKKVPAVHIPRNEVGHVEIWISRLGVGAINVYAPDGKAHGSWTASWLGFHQLKLILLLRRFDYRHTTKTFNRFTGTWVDV